MLERRKVYGTRIMEHFHGGSNRVCIVRVQVKQALDVVRHLYVHGGSCRDGNVSNAFTVARRQESVKNVVGIRGRKQRTLEDDERERERERRVNLIGNLPSSHGAPI